MQAAGSRQLCVKSRSTYNSLWHCKKKGEKGHRRVQQTASLWSQQIPCKKNIFMINPHKQFTHAVYFCYWFMSALTFALKSMLQKIVKLKVSQAAAATFCACFCRGYAKSQLAKTLPPSHTHTETHCWSNGKPTYARLCGPAINSFRFC